MFDNDTYRSVLDNKNKVRESCYNIPVPDWTSEHAGQAVYNHNS